MSNSMFRLVMVAAAASFSLSTFLGSPAQADDSFEYKAYLRSGVLENGEGGKGVPFQAPGSPTKYRLGNEAETYGEAILVKYFNQDAQEGPRAKVETLLAYKTLQNNQWASDTDEFTIREAFAEFTNLGFSPDAKVWAGNRFYLRQDIHIIDYYWFDTSGYGGGIMDLPVFGQAKLHLAYLRGAPDNAVELKNIGLISKQVVDIRLADIPVGFGTLTVGVLPSFVKGGTYETTMSNGEEEEKTVTTVDDEYGTGVTVYHDKSFGKRSNNRLAVQYGNGVARDIGSALWATPTPITSDSWKLQVLDYGVIQPCDSFAMMFTAIYQLTDSGADENSRSDWFSFGIRPTYYFNKYYSLAVEAGIDHTRQEGAAADGGDLNGTLGKLTLCPQISLDNSFWARPVLRGFVTLAKWSDDFEGQIGGEAYREKTAGVLYGVQLEAWF